MRYAFVLLMACTPPAQRPALVPPDVHVSFDVAGEVEGAPAPPVATTESTSPCRQLELQQPPEQKLVLGHYCNPRLKIGLVIDRTGEREARLRFDGAADTIRLVPRYTWHRTEYFRGGEKVLEVSSRGYILLFVSGHEVWLARDGDAEPL
jgi:hypothetical protein